MKQIKNICFFTVFTLFATPNIHSMGNFDFGQMENLQQELEEANKVIEEYISNLPDDEQEEFNRAVDEISQMFDNMSEEEFSAFLNEMFAEEAMTSPTESFSQSPQPMPVETVALTTEQKKKVENVIKVINDIVRQSNILLVQIGSSLEASKNIDNWSNKNSIMNWQPNAQWKDLKLEIEKFVQQLYKMEDKDLSTQDYKYILDLIEDEATLNNLIQLQTNLNASVPQIEISELDIKKLSSQAKTAIKNTLQHYTEALYVLQIPKAFDTIFEKYTSKADKYREAEEAAEKKATEAAKRPRVPVGQSTAGVAESSGGYGGYEPSYSGYDYNSYGGDYGYSPDYYGGGYGDSFGGYSGNDSFGKDRQSGSGGGMGGGSGSSAGAGSQPEAQKTPFTAGATAAPTKDPIIKDLINNIKTSINQAADIIEKDSLFATLDKHLVGKEDTNPVNTDLANEIEDLNKKINALEQEIETLQGFMLKKNTTTQKYYIDSLSAGITKPMATIITFKNSLEAIKPSQLQSKVTPEKQWAYFNADDKVLEKIKKSDAGAPEKVQELMDKVPTRISLTDLLTTITKFETTVSTLKAKVAQPKTPTTVVTPPATPIVPTEPV